MNAINGVGAAMAVSTNAIGLSERGRNKNHGPRHRAGYGSLSATEKRALDRWDEGAAIEQIAAEMRLTEHRVMHILRNFLPGGSERRQHIRDTIAGRALLFAQLSTGQHFLTAEAFGDVVARNGWDEHAWRQRAV